MAALDCRHLKQDAQDRLGRISGDPRLLILLYTGVMVLLNLLVSGLNVYLDRQIGSTGGLSGLGARSILESIQSILSYMTVLFTPFWSAGFLYSVIQIARSGRSDPKFMLEGFRRFPSIIVFNLNQTLLIFFAATMVTYAASYIFMMTPFSHELEQVIGSVIQDGSILSSGGVIDLQAISPDILLHASIPLFIIFIVLFIPVYAFLSYSLRLGSYLVMQGPRVGGFAAMMLSFRMMKGHRLQMFKLDLSFWWYYLIEGLLTLILYLDLILPLFGITLPFDATLLFFIKLLVYSGCQILFHLWKKLPVDTTYVLSYDAIASEHPLPHM